jgi:hypothetical protein
VAEQDEATHGTYRVRLDERAVGDLAALRAGQEGRELVFALMEIAHRMSREPYEGQPVAGAISAILGPLDSLWRLEFDVAGWPGKPRFVLHHFPPNLSHPTDVVWMAIGRAT